jgi:hypothetical protein
VVDTVSAQATVRGVAQFPPNSAYETVGGATPVYNPQPLPTPVPSRERPGLLPAQRPLPCRSQPSAAGGCSSVLWGALHTRHMPAGPSAPPLPPASFAHSKQTTPPACSLPRPCAVAVPLSSADPCAVT